MNKGALWISFGSPSTGFTDALGRIFSRVRCNLLHKVMSSVLILIHLFQVGFINFSPYYRNLEKPVERVVDSAGVVTLTCAEDTLSGDSAQKVRASLLSSCDETIT